MIANGRLTASGRGCVLRHVSHGVLLVTQIPQHLIAGAGTLIGKHVGESLRDSRFRRLEETPEQTFNPQTSPPGGDSGRRVRESRRDSPTWARRPVSIAFRLSSFTNPGAMGD